MSLRRWVWLVPMLAALLAPWLHARPFECAIDVTEITVQARPEALVSLPIGSCPSLQVGSGALVVSASVSSHLVRARGQVVVRFFTRSGRELPAWESEPLLGQFTDLASTWSIALPQGAARATIAATVQSDRPDAAGAFTVRAVTAARGVETDLRSLDGDAVVAHTAPRWIVVMPLAPAGTTIAWRLTNVDGGVVSQAEPSLVVGGQAGWKAPPLRPGYYVLTALILAPAGISQPVSRSFAVMPAVRSADPRFGVDAALSWYGGDEVSVRRSAAMLGRAGVGSVRDRLSWARVQPQPTRVTWGRYRDVARWVYEAGLQQVTTFHDSPEWVRPGDRSDSADKRPPTDMSAVQEFGRRFAVDMAPWVHAVEFWNEPNSAFFAGPPWLYANALKHFSVGVRSADADTLVLLGSTAGRPGRFFANVFANGVAPFVTHRNNHSYLDGVALADFLQRQVQPMEKTGGLSSHPAWLTEVGYSLKRDARGSLDEAEREQARHLVRSMAVALGIGYERVFYFFFRELLEAQYHTWGIVRKDFSPRPAYVALATMIGTVDRRPLYGATISPSRSLIVFGTPESGFVGIGWGDWAPSELGRSVSTSDIYGRETDPSARIGLDPVFITNLPNPSVQRASSLPDRDGHSFPVAFLVVDVAGTASPGRRSEHRLEEPVAEDTVVRLRGTIVAADGSRPSRTAADVQCRGTDGLELVAGPTLRPGSDSAGFTYECAFHVTLAAVGRGSLTMHASSREWRDVGRIDVVADAAFVAAGRRAGSGLAEVCLDWIPRASDNVNLELRSTALSTPGLCPSATLVAGQVTRAKETWIFPLARSDASAKSSIGVVFDVSPAPEAGAWPSRPMLLQINDVDGSVWTVELQASNVNGRQTRYAGLYALASVAPWSKPSRYPRLDPQRIASMSLGFGAHGGQVGERLAYRIDRQYLIPAK